MTGVVDYALDSDGTGWITLNRPDAGNSRNQEMRDALIACYDQAAHDERVRVVVLTGAGNRFFCTGMDLKEASSASESSESRAARMRGSRDIEALASLDKPTIAAINGYALGGGLEMALACDLRIVAAGAKLGLPEITHGLVPGGGATQRLPALIGPARTYELLYLGEPITAEQSVTWGLCNRSVPLSELRDAAAELARTIAEKAPAAVRVAKSLVQASKDTPLPEGIESELDALLQLLEARDGHG